MSLTIPVHRNSSYTQISYMDAIERPGEGQTKLCAICSQIRISQSVEEPISGHISNFHHTTLDGFIQAVKQDCYICVAIWNKLGKSSWGRDSWLRQSWIPLRFSVHTDFTGRSLHRLNITYTPPCKDPNSIVEILLTPFEAGTERLPHNLLLGDSTGCQTSIEAARSWSEECINYHSRCREYSPRAGTWHPTRLIDVGIKGQEQPYLRLHDTTTDGTLSHPVSYIALSYRWSPNPQILLLTSTIEEFRKGKPLRDLPQTFHDLAAVAQAFSIRYIWIDALCIIQDSTEDWNVESLTMRHVYANAACTVSASASLNEDDGLFRTRSPRSILPGIAVLPTAFSRAQSFYMFEHDYWDTNIFTGPLHKRGWVFQERHLSPRVLYFGAFQILWGCFESANCEGFPVGIPYHPTDKNFYEPLALPDAKRTRDLQEPSPEAQEIMPIRVYAQWCAMVELYTQCALTRQSDKLPAFAGIAKLFQEATRDEYIAGIWRSRLLESLDWRVDEPIRKASAEYRAPSWSWASIDGPVKHALIGVISKQLVKLVAVEIQTQTSDPTGPVTSGYLTVRALLSTVVVEGYEEGDTYRVSIMDSRRDSAKHYTSFIRLLFALDYQGMEIYKGQTLHLVPLNSSLWKSDLKPPNEVQVVFLILVSHVEGQQSQYFRIGHLILTEPGQIELFGLRAGNDGLMVVNAEETLTEITIL
ncbi:heterokaryon incompatibility protein-domain-containing protein [Aspergillus multicolor]|uniref:HET domain-containing protein n=1 Tax=Aspergillus multicolor TaxID=41759 RepID=UPI003CCD5E20